MSRAAKVAKNAASKSPWAMFKAMGGPGEGGLSHVTGLPVDSSLKRHPQEIIRDDLLQIAKERNVPIPTSFHEISSEHSQIRLPRAVQALYLAPLRRTPTHGITVANLQIRSFSLRNLEFMADFAMRAAYYLNLPAKGPVPLPRITERWTVPRGHFVHKKTQENWERVTLRRLIQIQDGHPDVVQRWLAFVRKWQWYGVGMKADVFECEGLGTAKKMDENEQAVKEGLESVNWDLVGRRKGQETEEEIAKMLEQDSFAYARPSRTQTTPADPA